MQHKSERMVETALAHGWKAQLKPIIPEDKDYNKILWNVYAVREKESLHVVFTGNRQTEATYIFGDVKTHPPHRAAVMSILTGTPDYGRLERREKRKYYASKKNEVRSVPFETDAPAIEILIAVLGKEITWVRTIDGVECTDHISKSPNLGSKYFRVYEARTGRRLLEWQNYEGFHAVALDQIVNVG